MKKYKIGWQKYEDVIEQQMSSPALKNVMKNMIMDNNNKEDMDPEDDEDDIFAENNDEYEGNDLLMVPLSEKVLNELSIASTFDCWVGHTNFDITNRIKDKLNTIQGIEMLKIFTRYRFFIGVGKMFNFKDVRNSIEKEIIPKE